MRRPAAAFRLTDEELKTLEGWVRQGKTEQRLVELLDDLRLDDDGPGRAQLRNANENCRRDPDAEQADVEEPRGG